MLNTRAGELFNANTVVNPNDLRKRILNIDSRFRSDLTQPTTDFTFKFTQSYKNLIRLRIASVEIPNMFYTFTKKNNFFTIRALDIDNQLRIVTITIKEGNYTSTDLINAIQTELNTKLRDPFGIFFTIDLDLNNAKVTLTNNGVSAYPVTSVSPAPTASGKSFFVIFSQLETYKKRPSAFGLGYNLGFRCPVYNVTKSKVATPSGLTEFFVTTEGCIDVVGDTYMFLNVNDLHTVEQTAYNTYLQVLAKIIIRDEKFGVIYDDGSNHLSNEIIFPAPMDLKQLNVQLLDPYGDVIDLNCMNFSFSIEITEVLNTSLYDFYRNYIWLGTIPSAGKSNGSALTLLNGPR
jgi:hypothetical protein